MSWAERAPAVVRLFPLSGVVLFPGATLPLHIFEPRYRQMTQDALACDRRIAMALPRTTCDDEPRPIERIVCVGTIHGEMRLPDGRFKMILKGEGRLRITSELSMGDKLYRRAYVVPIEDELRPHGAFGRRMQRTMILGQLRRLARSPECPTLELYRHLRDRCADGSFVDLLAYSLPSPVEFKQRLLDASCVDDRMDLLCDELTRLTGVPEVALTEASFSEN